MVGGPGDDAGFEAITRERWIARGRAEAGGGASGPAARSVAAGEPVAVDEVVDVYLPLARWIEDRLDPRRGDRGHGAGDLSTTAVIVITGSVAAGKTTTARVLAGLLRQGPAPGAVDLLTTDGFLYPNRVLEQRGLLDRKGFPESYDHQALATTLAAVRSGRTEVAVPVYSHGRYDIVPGQVQWIRRPRLLVVEGLTVLQPAAVAGALVDLGVYLDADEASVARWHTRRLMALRCDADAGTEPGAEPGADAGVDIGPSEFQRWFRSLSDADARRVAASSWSEINLVNLREHVAPTRQRADVILEKGADHRVRRVLLRTGPVPVG